MSEGADPALATVDSSLAEYAARRDFAHTPEPPPSAEPARAADSSVVAHHSSLRLAAQPHPARRMHFDLRLELDGALKSWAVPNGFSAEPSEKRLAVATEDHPLEYLAFEGVIPRGHYGAGEMIVWDRGDFWPEEDRLPPPASREDAAERFRRGLASGRLKIHFAGRKLRGSWSLVRTSRGPRDWLLIRRSDGPAPHLDDDRSVICGL